MIYTDRRIQCECGHLQGVLSGAAAGVRLTCYCKDCQAYAHALNNAGEVLDKLGGTNVVTTLQQHVRFTKGTDKLACLSLSDKGLLRWYASCCNTPIGNTARDPKMSFVALSHSCLRGAIDSHFGGDSVHVNAKSAKGKVASSGVAQFFATARIIGAVLGARANGNWKHSPFFRPGTPAPVASPRVLSSDERSRYTRTAAAM